MRLSLSWLKKFVDTQASLQEIADVLTARGIEADYEEADDACLKQFIVADVVSCEKHPHADTLSLCQVSLGLDEAPTQVVCGAPNVRQGLKVAFAPVGTEMPDGETKLTARKIRKICSYGMICSGIELGISNEEDSILELPADATTGMNFAAWCGYDQPTIKITPLPNRSDCLSVVGIAREIAAAGLGKLINEKTPQQLGDVNCDEVQLQISDQNLCTYFSICKLSGLTNRPSPDWLRRTLQSAGLRSISAIVDVTNYVMLCLGQPLHAFDAQAVSGKFEVAKLATVTEFQVLNQTSYQLPAGSCVIKDGTQLLSLAGIKGGLNSGCSEQTTTVYLEAAVFNPENIAVTSGLLGLTSESSIRFARGVNQTYTEQALEMAKALLLELCGGQASQVKTVGKLQQPAYRTKLRWSRLTSILGFSFDQNKVQKLLESSGFAVQKSSADVWQLQVPSWRPDCCEEINLIEEILRLVGYDHIPYKQQLTSLTALPLPANRLTALTSKRLLASRGLHEIVSYAFIPEAEALSFSDFSNQLKLANSIIGHLDTMRPSLLPNLLRTAKYDQQNSQLRSSLFEVAEVYHPEVPERQQLAAAVLRCGLLNEADWRDQSRKVDLYDVKDDLGALLTKLGVDETSCQVVARAPKWYDQQACGSILNQEGQVVAYFGKLDQQLTENLGLLTPVLAAEINLQQVLATEKITCDKIKLQAENNLPVVKRDFTFIVDEKVEAGKILQIMQASSLEAVEGVVMLSQYRDPEKLGQGKKSLTYRVLLRSSEKMLTGKDIRHLSSRLSELVASQVEVE